MGQYYIIVNTTKKEYIEPHAFGGMSKFVEHNELFYRGLALLIADGYGNGTYERIRHSIIGSWANDRIVMAGDYGMLTVTSRSEKNLHAAAAAWKDISTDVVSALSQDDDWREDLRRLLNPTSAEQEADRQAFRDMMARS